MTDVVQVTVTFGSRDEAERVGRAAVEARAAACAQITGPITSYFWWKDALEEAEEWYCVLKTTRDRFRDIETVIREAHSYEVPEILAVPVIEGSSDYLAWVQGELDSGR
jgi:periplasmic divalent cation tolerance protein